MRTTEPSDMTPEQRTAELATLLAQGVLRLRKQAARTGIGDSDKTPESAGDGVEVSRKTRLSVTRG